MTASWPGTVNQDLEDGSYRESIEVNRAEFTPEVGPPKRRRRTSISTSLISYSTILTLDERTDLIAFYKDDLKDGSLEFTRKHPLTRVNGIFQFAEEPSFIGITRKTLRASISLREMP